MRNRLVELIKHDNCISPATCSSKCKYVDSDDCHAERLADYLLANGVVVLFPKVGKKIYIHQFDNKMKKVVVECKIIKKNNADGLFKVKLADGRRLTLLYQFVGKTVFLAREEAEKALNDVTDKHVGGKEKGGAE